MQAETRPVSAANEVCMGMKPVLDDARERASRSLGFSEYHGPDFLPYDGEIVKVLVPLTNY